MDYKSFFNGKKVTVMGLGLLGRGIGDIAFLARQGAELIVTDLKTEAELTSSLELLKQYADITYHLGGHQNADFENRDFILKASGVPLDSPYILHARKNHIPVEMSVALFAKFFKGPMVGITGSLGKTTTTHMIGYLLSKAHIKNILAGNVRGGSTLTLLEEIESDTTVVLELDSWSLQGFGEAKISPNVSVFTAFVPDHMNYYKGDMNRYFADKANIFLNQTPEDTFVCAESVVHLVKEKYAREVRAQLVIAKASDVPKKIELHAPGDHNRLNAACAVKAAEALGVDVDFAWEAIAEFTGVDGRLSHVRNVRGISIYNDTAATTPLAAAAGLTALDAKNEKCVVAIMGGAGKDLPLQELSEAVKAHAKAVVFLPGSGTDLLKPLIEGVEYTDADTLEGAFEKALSYAKEGDVVTLTPGFASFGLFKNMYERGDQFVEMVHKAAEE